MPRKLKNLYHLVRAFLANALYFYPSRKLVIIGVTGTDGKTTTVNLIHHILTKAGYKAAIWSTLSSAHTTTPDAFKLQKFLAQAVKNGCSHVVLEVSSHAIDQNRIWGIKFTVGVLTNIADHEHLDYHKTFENYHQTKLKFLNSCQFPITKDNWPNNFRFETSLLGEFNRQNILSAVGAGLALKIPKETIQIAIKNFEPPAGRLEIVVKKPFTVIVDFAHTPQAFEKVLPVVKKLGKRLIHVFGATGDRDRAKRPIMGKIASQFDDIIILTSEDTYTENPTAIIAQVETGVTIDHLVVPDRKEALKKALELSKPGDVIISTGVGHQRSMNQNGRELPWNEPEIIKELLKDVYKK